MRVRSVLVVALIAMGCASTTRAPKVVIDTADRGAYTALRTFQVSEEAAYHGHLGWPTPVQHQAINGKVSQAYTLIVNVAQLGMALPPGGSLSIADLAVVGQLTQVVTDIVALATSADAGTQQAARATQTQVTALITAVKGGR